MSDPNAITPHRQTRLVLGVNEKTFLTPAWHLHVPGENLGRYIPGTAPPSQNVWQMPDGSWILRPHAADMSRLLHSAYNGGILTATDFNAAPTMGTLLTTPQTGGFGGGALSPATHWQKEIADPSTESTANSHNELLADAAAFPKTPNTNRAEILGDPSGIYTNQVPMDRVLSGNKIYEPNQAWALSITAPTGHWNVDSFFTFYFGGQTVTYPLGTRGGEFALTLQGDGEAVLWERDPRFASGWGPRQSFQWAEPGRATDNQHVLQIIPYGLNKIAFRNRASQVILPQALPFTGAVTPAFMGPQSEATGLYEELDLQSGHQHLNSMTGAGPVRTDIRRDHQDTFVIARLDYPSHGFLVGDTFSIGHIPADNELIYLTPKGYVIPGVTAINFTAYSSDGVACTGEPLINGFRTQAGKTQYYLIYDFVSSDPSQTPVLEDIDFDMDPVEQEHEIPTQTGGLIQSVWINQGIPDQEIALVNVEDTDLELGYLHDRGGTRARLLDYDTRGETPVVKSVHFEGRAVAPKAEMVRGAGEFIWPGSGWRSFPNLQLVGLFADLAQHPIADPKDYSKDPKAPGLTWKVTDAIRDLFHGAGATDAELDIPDLQERLSAGALQQVTLMAQFASDPTILINYLIRDVLNTDWTRDFNAGELLTDGTPRGMWRVLGQVDYTNPLLTFYVNTPASVLGKDPVCLDSYPARSCWVESYREYPTQAENNAVEITGLTAGLFSLGRRKLVARLRNFAGLSNPDHPDFINGFKAYVPPPDPVLTTQHDVDKRARIEYRRRCHGLQRFELRAPLVRVTDSKDVHQRLERALRQRDAVIVSDGVTERLATIENCVLSWDRDSGGDAIQMMDIEGRFRVNLADGEVF